MSIEQAPGPDVRRAGATCPSVGVEEEFLLVDPDTGQPRLCNTEVATAAEKLGLSLQLELSKCQVETNTQVCWDSRTLRAHLLEMRTLAASAARTAGCRLLAVGAPMVGPWRLPISESKRYRHMAERFGELAIEQGVCGCHVHVDVPERELAVQVCNHVRLWLPIVLALSANSAVHRGIDSSYASWRSILWSRWPTSGPPPMLDSVQHYDQFVDMMVGSGALMDERMVYWDIRPSSHLPTVEIRVADVQPTVDGAELLATLIRALVMTATRAIDRGDSAPAVDLEILRAATWVAARDGLTGKAIDPYTARPTTPRHQLAALVDHAHDSLDELGEYRRTQCLLHRQLDQGNGAVWQRRALRERGNAAEVVRMGVGRTLQDTAPSADCAPTGEVHSY